MLKKLLVATLMLFTMGALTSCDKDDAKKEASNFLSMSGAPALSLGLGCETGKYTQPFLQGELYSILKVNKKGAKELQSLKRKGVGKVVCVTAMTYLKSVIPLWTDTKLSEEMRADKCSTANLLNLPFADIVKLCPK